MQTRPHVNSPRCAQSLRRIAALLALSLSSTGCVTANPDYIEGFDPDALEKGGALAGGGGVGGSPVAGVEGGSSVAGVEGGSPVAGVEGGSPVAGVEGGSPVAGIEGGSPVAGVTPAPVDQDMDGSPEGEDCDDNDPERTPGVQERCDEVDHDCDGDPYNGFPTLGQMCIFDQVGSCVARSSFACAPDGFSAICEPVPRITTSEESCDELDNDCDGRVDEAGVCDVACVSSPERCDELDNDCDGAIDEGLAQQCSCQDSELCNGADDDCDGQVDESLDTLCIVEIATSPLGGPGDHLGASLLSVSDLNGDGYPELIASGPGGSADELEELDPQRIGVVSVIHGQTGELLWETSGTGAFGASVALGDFNGDGDLELAIGAPRRSLNNNDMGVVQIVAYQGATLTTLSSPDRRDVMLGSSLISLELDSGTRLIVGEPQFRERNNSSIFWGRVRGLSFNSGWNNPTEHFSLSGDFFNRRLGERLHKIPSVVGDADDDVVTTYVNDNQRSTWLLDPAGGISAETSLSPMGASRRFGEGFVSYQLNDGSTEYAISDPSARFGQGRIWWFSPTLGTGLFSVPNAVEAWGRSLASVPRADGGLIFAGSSPGTVYVQRSFTNTTPIETGLTLLDAEPSFGASLSASSTPAIDGTYRLFVGVPEQEGSRGQVRIYSVR